MSRFTLREITPADFSQEIHNVMQAAYSVEAQLLEVAEFFPLRRTVQDIAGTKNQFLGVFESDELVGVCELEELGHDAVLIASIVVKPENFRQGVASILLNYVIEAFRAKRLCVSTAEKNLAAVNLYKKHGFAIYERETLQDGMKLVKLKYSPAS